MEDAASGPARVLVKPVRASAAGRSEAVHPPLSSSNSTNLKANVVRAEQYAQNGSHLDYRPLPHGLVGPRCSTTALVEGYQCKCILDTGSQVTTVSETFYSDHLSSFPVEPINALLEILGAGGQRVPYIGYTQVLISLPKSVTGIEEKISSLVLIVPDCDFNGEIPLLVGTNVLDRLYQNGVKREGLKFLQGHELSDECLMLFQYIAQTHSEEEEARPVKLLGRYPVVIPAGQRVCVLGGVKIKTSPTLTSYAMEPPANPPLPGGIFLVPTLLDVPYQSFSKVPVLLRNMSSHNITLHPNRVIAEMMMAQCVVPVKPHDTSISCGLQTVDTEAPPSDKVSCSLEDSPIPAEWKKRIKDKLNTIPEVFAVDDLTHGRTSAVKHRIRLQDETPFKERPRPIHPCDREAVKQHLRELLEAGIIRESESPFASPIVVVKKKNGKIRLCVDYRKLNMRTIKDAYALPNIEETFSALSGAKWFSVMDLKSGYYQVELAEEDKHKTAFTCPLGFWEFNRMPQGVTNAPSTFQRLMERCVGDLHLNEVLVFLDDLIVFSDTLEEHENRLMKVLNRLKDYGLKLSPDKCHFFQSSVKYLGHIVDARGVHTDPEKISALKDWPRPTNRKELKCFLGFAGYYRRFVQGYSKIAKQLNALTAGYVATRKRGKDYKKQKPHTSVSPSQPFGSEWTQDCETAFRTLIDRLTSAPVLAFANPNLPYVLHTDACGEGLGAAIYQEHEGTLRAIAYASRGLSKSERNYPTHKLEYLALKWAVCEKFHDYLYGTEFTVLTDNNPLTYVLTSAKLDAAGHRWLAALSTYRFEVKYRPGNTNQDADGLSRRPQEPSQEDDAFLQEKERIEELRQRVLDGNHKVLSEDTFTALCQRHSVRLEPCEYPPEPPALAESLAVDPSAIPLSYTCLAQKTVPGMTQEDWHNSQRADLSIRRVIQLIERDTKPSFRETKLELPEVRLFLREWNRLELKDGVLFRRYVDRGTEGYQLVLPEKYRAKALEGVHDEVGHLGFERALHLARARFYWPKMAQAVDVKCHTCERCFRRKTIPERAAPMMNISTSYPLELVCMDYLSIEPDNKDTRNVLVITDHFTKFAVAIPTKDQRARTVAKAIWENFIVHYGFPARLHSDQGRDFESHTIKELCSLIGAEKVRTTPYHPRGNPVERFNRTLLGMLGTLEDKDKYHWRDFVKPLVHAYNCTRNNTTGYSPYELMFGRQPTLPIDLVLGFQPQGNHARTHSEYVKSLRERLRESYALAAESARKMGEKNKTRFNAKVRAAELIAGDRVLVRNVNIRGKHKLADRWERGTYTVEKRMGDGPVYVVKPDKGGGPLRTLHRDLLLPCGFLPVTDGKEVEQKGPSKVMKLRSGERPTMDARDNMLSHEEDVDVCSSSDEEELVVVHRPKVIEMGPFIKTVERSVERRPRRLRSDSDQTPTAESLEAAIGNIRHALDHSLQGELQEHAVEPLHDNLEPVDTDQRHECDHRSDLTAVEEEVAAAINPLLQAEQSENIGTQAEIRRSSRTRQRPDRLHYDTLGRPLILAIVAFCKSLEGLLQGPARWQAHEGTNAF